MLHFALGSVLEQLLAAAATPATLDDRRVSACCCASWLGTGIACRVVAADGADNTRGLYEAAVAAGCTKVLVPTKQGAGGRDVTGPLATPGGGERPATRTWQPGDWSACDESPRGPGGRSLPAAPLDVSPKWPPCSG
jgi:hypothetical protein